MDSTPGKSFEGWSTDRIVEELEQQLEQNVPFENREAIKPYTTELKNRVGLFTGDLTPAQVAEGQQASSSAH